MGHRHWDNPGLDAKRKNTPGARSPNHPEDGSRTEKRTADIGADSGCSKTGTKNTLKKNNGHHGPWQRQPL